MTFKLQYRLPPSTAFASCSDDTEGRGKQDTIMLAPSRFVIRVTFIVVVAVSLIVNGRWMWLMASSSSSSHVDVVNEVPSLHNTRKLTSMIMATDTKGDATTGFNYTTTDFTKIIWMYWGEGLDQLRAIPSENSQSKYASDAACVEATIRLHPDWTVNVLDKESAGTYAPLYAKLRDNDKEGVFEEKKYSNLLRVELLYRYGGVWADCSVCPFHSYNVVIPQLLGDFSGGFYVNPLLRHAGSLTGRKLEERAEKCHVKMGCNGTDYCDKSSKYSRSFANWFMVAAHPGLSLYKMWMEKYYENCMHYIRKNSTSYPYCIAHCSFTQVRVASPSIESVWQGYVRYQRSHPLGKGVCWGAGGKKWKRPTASRVASRDCWLVKRPSESLAGYVQSPSYINYIDNIVAEKSS